MSELIVVHESRESTRIVHIFNDIDIANASEFASEIESAAAGASQIVIELTWCKYLDACALRVLVHSRNVYGKRLLIVAPPGSSAKRLLEITELDGWFALADSLDQVTCAPQRGLHLVINEATERLAG